MLSKLRTPRCLASLNCCRMRGTTLLPSALSAPLLMPAVSLVALVLVSLMPARLSLRARSLGLEVPPKRTTHTSSIRTTLCPPSLLSKQGQAPKSNLQTLLVALLPPLLPGCPVCALIALIRQSTPPPPPPRLLKPSPPHSRLALRLLLLLPMTVRRVQGRGRRVGTN